MTSLNPAKFLFVECKKPKFAVANSDFKINEIVH